MKLKDPRLGIFKDMCAENAYVFKTKEITFARANKVNNTWHVWFYNKHIQKDFSKMREACIYINKEFIDFYKSL